MQFAAPAIQERIDPTDVLGSGREDVTSAALPEPVQFTTAVMEEVAPATEGVAQSVSLMSSKVIYLELLKTLTRNMNSLLH
jgi:hypothetical protein